MDYFELNLAQFDRDELDRMLRYYLRTEFDYHLAVDITDVGDDEHTLGIKIEEPLSVSSRYVFEQRLQEYLLEHFRNSGVY